MRTYSLLLFFLFTTSFAWAQYPLVKNKSYTAYQVSTRLLVDGKADERAWQQAQWTDAFVDIEGDRQPMPEWNTRVKMLWDTSYLYFYAEMEEPHIWATLTQRDTIIFYNNDFEIFIDPDGDLQTYMEYEVNAFNTVWDLLLTRAYRDRGNAVNQWDIDGLQSAVHIEGTLNQSNDQDKYWSVEVAIPWKVIQETTRDKLPPKNGDHFRINFSRVQWETEIINGSYVKKTNPQTGKPLPENNWVWSPQRAINMHEPEFWGVVFFSTQKVNDARATPFEINSAREEVRQLLTYIHRQQLLHKKNFKKFTTQPEQLLKAKTFSTGEQVSWQLLANEYFYHAQMTHPALPNERWHIDASGKLWQTKQ